MGGAKWAASRVIGVSKAGKLQYHAQAEVQAEASAPEAAGIGCGAGLQHSLVQRVPVRSREYERAVGICSVVRESRYLSLVIDTPVRHQRSFAIALALVYEDR